VAIGGFNFVFPFYLQQILLFTPVATGLFMSIYPLVLAAVSPVSGWLTDKFGPEILSLLGLASLTAGFFCFASLGRGSPMLLPVLYVSLMAVGNGLFQAPNNTLVMSSLPANKVGIGGSVNALVRNIGTSFGVVLSTFILYTGISSAVGYHVTDYVPGQEDAFMHGMRVTYLVIGLVGVLGILMTISRLFRRKNAS
jgi:MFS family permease